MKAHSKSRAPRAVLPAAAALAMLATAALAQTGRPPQPAPRPAPASPVAASTAPSLPGGATSLQEAHGDWVVGCAVQNSAKRCWLRQEQANEQTRQRVLAIEVTPVGDRIEGVLLMPFGLVLDQGVVVQVDDQPPGQPLRFRTCLPSGCVAAISFDARQTTALRSGTALKLRVVPEGGQPAELSISLNGLGSGLDRTAALAR
jgi:invasion protein IalB